MECRLGVVSAMLVCSTLAGCASSYQLTKNAIAERAGMNQQQAVTVLQHFAKVTDKRGGICMIGIHSPPTRLDLNEPVRFSGTTITVSGIFAHVGNAQVSGNVMAGTGQVSVSYYGVQGQASVDTRHVKELRILDINTANKLQIYQADCPTVKSGYLVVFKSQTSLPDSAELAFNVTSQDDIDSVLAALSYLSPNARMVQGIGM